MNDKLDQIVLPIIQSRRSAACGTVYELHNDNGNLLCTLALLCLMNELLICIR
jgi:hypothetical protein